MVPGNQSLQTLYGNFEPNNLIRIKYFVNDSLYTMIPGSLFISTLSCLNTYHLFDHYEITEAKDY